MDVIREYRKQYPKAHKACTASKKHVHRIARRRNKIPVLPGNLDDEARQAYEDMDALECDPERLSWEAFNIYDYW